LFIKSQYFKRYLYNFAFPKPKFLIILKVIKLTKINQKIRNPEPYTEITDKKQQKPGNKQVSPPFPTPLFPTPS
jgi:hypothetical protein